MNRIKVNLQRSIIVLAVRGWSKLRIARELKVDRRTVDRHVAANAATNPGVGFDSPANAASPGVGSRPGPASRCAPYEGEIVAAVEASLTAKRIHQDLRERGLAGGYSQFKLFVSRLRLTVELPHRRMECEPGGGDAV